MQYTFKVQEMLDESPIWKQYKDQKMDLFLADKPRFAIEASPGQTNLYLTQVRDINNIYETQFLRGFNIIFKGSSVPDAPPPVS